MVGLPGTIDNDLYGTDYTIGYDTAINTALDAVDKIRDTADSHSRIFFIEVMGRDAGFIAMDTGVAGAAEAILVPERTTDLQELADTIERNSRRQKTSQVIIVSEGDDAGGVIEVVEKLKKMNKTFDHRVVVLGHIQRGGSPTARDRVLATRLGVAAVEALLRGESSTAIGVVDNQINYVSFDSAIQLEKPISNDLLEYVKILNC